MATGEKPGHPHCNVRHSPAGQRHKTHHFLKSSYSKKAPLGGRNLEKVKGHEKNNI